MTKPVWRIYYDDRRIFSSDDGDWNDAPTDGVLFVIQKLGDKVATMSGSDHYVMLDGTDIIATQDIGPLLRKLGFIKFGRWTTIKTYEEISRQVAEDARSWQLSPGT
jgi:hypothetical protein